MPASVDNPVLILVQPGVANPQDRPGMPVYEYTVRWPAAAPPSYANRILAIGSGVPLRGTDKDLTFARKEVNGWSSLAYSVLSRSGYFYAQSRVWQGSPPIPVSNDEGVTRVDARLLGLSGPTVRSMPLISIASKWPAGKPMVFGARDSEEVGQVMSQTSGRILIVEYPPRNGEYWNHLELAGQGWPGGLPVDPNLQIPGLIPAEKLSTLLLDPKRFEWQDPSSTWSGADRWLDFVNQGRPIVSGVAGVLALAVAIASAYVVAQERKNAWLAGALRALLLFPASLVVAGNLTRLLGFPGSLVWIAVSYALLYGFATMLNTYLPRLDRRENISAFALVSFFALVTTDPRYSLYSAVLGPRVTSAPVEALGALFASFSLLRVPRSATLWAGGLLLMSGIFLPMWWSPFAVLWLLPVAIRWRPRYFGLAVGALAGGWLIPKVVAAKGYAFSPKGLLASVSDAGKLNSYDLFSFVFSPGFLVSAFLFAALAVFGSGFFVHQIRRTWRFEPTARRLAGLGGVLALFSLGAPELLNCALFVLFAAAIVLFEALLAPVEA